jgi:corrinoid protein of di/trimethylamine methyltransferase
MRDNMSKREKILQILFDSVVGGDAERAGMYAQQALDAGIPPLVAIEKGLTRGICEVGNQFSQGEIYLPELVMAAEAMETALAVFKPHIQGDQSRKKGKVLIGTVKGDIHDLGKNIVIALLRVNGYDVTDLGRDIPPASVVDRAIEEKSDIIGLSCLLTTTMPMMREVIDIMKQDGVRDRFKVIIGGGPTSQAFANQIGADGYGDNAQDAVDLCDRLLGVKGS